MIKNQKSLHGDGVAGRLYRNGQCARTVLDREWSDCTRASATVGGGGGRRRRRPATSGRCLTGSRRPMDGHAQVSCAFPLPSIPHHGRKPQLNRGARTTPRRGALSRLRARPVTTAAAETARRSTGSSSSSSHADPKVAPVSRRPVDDRYFTFVAQTARVYNNIINIFDNVPNVIGRAKRIYDGNAHRRRTLQSYTSSRNVCYLILIFFFSDGRRAAVAATCQSNRTDPGSRHIDSGRGRQLYTPHNVITRHGLCAERIVKTDVYTNYIIIYTAYIYVEPTRAHNISTPYTYKNALQ